MLIRPRLLLEPSGDPLLNLFLRNHSTRANVGEALRDLLLHIDVVLDVLERRVIRKLLKELLHVLFRRWHRHLPRIASTVAEMGVSEKGLSFASQRTVEVPPVAAPTSQNGLTTRFQPRRLMITPAVVGCKSLILIQPSPCRYLL